jgi:hypothetical protein
VPFHHDDSKLGVPAVTILRHLFIVVDDADTDKDINA